MSFLFLFHLPWQVSVAPILVERSGPWVPRSKIGKPLKSWDGPEMPQYNRWLLWRCRVPRGEKKLSETPHCWGKVAIYIYECFMTDWDDVYELVLIVNCYPLIVNFDRCHGVLLYYSTSTFWIGSSEKTLQRTNMSHLGKRKIIDRKVPW